MRERIHLDISDLSSPPTLLKTISEYSAQPLCDRSLSLVATFVQKFLLWLIYIRFSRLKTPKHIFITLKLNRDHSDVLHTICLLGIYNTVIFTFDITGSLSWTKSIV